MKDPLDIQKKEEEIVNNNDDRSSSISEYLNEIDNEREPATIEHLIVFLLSSDQAINDVTVCFVVF
jgi:hypothetical protein